MADSEKDKVEISPWKWITGLLVSAIGMLLIAGISWWASRKGKELAKLKHERDVLEAKADHDKVISKVESNELQVWSLQKSAAEANVKAAAIDEDIRRMEFESKKLKDQIDAINSWDSIDDLLGNSSERRSP